MKSIALGIAVLIPCVLSAAWDATALPAPPVNGRIVYSVGAVLPDPDPSADSQIYSVNPDGTHVVQLTHLNAPAQAGDPDVSPNGQQILYVSNQRGEFQIWLMRMDGSGQHRVIAYPGHDAFVPRWSPDGQHVIFTSCTSPFGFHECRISIAGIDGSDLHDLTGGHWNDFSAAYSPDGNSVAFSGDRNGFVSAIFGTPVTGGSLHRLTPAETEAFWPDYRPDGRRILFGNNFDRPHTDFFTMSPSGGHIVQLTDFAPGTQGGFARYSPDGQRIVFDYFDGTSDFLATMKADGSDFTKIVETGDGNFPLADWGMSS
jgi:Tol biopolymer transport system component